MYAWIWRQLPFGRPGRIVGSVLLVLVAAGLLWYFAFPAVDPHLPFTTSGEVSEQGGSGGSQPTTSSPTPPGPVGGDQSPAGSAHSSR